MTRVATEIRCQGLRGPAHAEFPADHSSPLSCQDQATQWKRSALEKLLPDQFQGYFEGECANGWKCVDETPNSCKWNALTPRLSSLRLKFLEYKDALNPLYSLQPMQVGFIRR